MPGKRGENRKEKDIRREIETEAEIHDEITKNME